MSATIFTPSPVNASERYLSRLCRRSFLRLWSWSNVYRDQKSGNGSVGKEVCDLLVVFDKHIFVFSDKYCAFPDTGNLSVDWERWLRRAVSESAKQVAGAERWIRNFPDRLFLDPGCEKPFPYELPPSHEAKYHRVVVAHGSAGRCREAFGGSGSLMLAPNEAQDSCIPFMLGRLDHVPGFVHVMDDFTLDTILESLDTVADLADYFEKKEELVSSGKLLSAAGEEDLLAYYLQRVNEEGKHHFDFPDDMDWVVVDEGHWESFRNHPDRLAKIEADKISYVWDYLIDQFAKNIFEGTEYFPSGMRLEEQEPGLRIMARELRTERRALAKSFVAVLERADRGERAARIVAPANGRGTYYVFLGVQPREDRTYGEYREVRRNMLEAYCLVTRLQNPEALDIVGIASEPMTSDGRSEDFLYLNGRVWNEHLEADASRLQSETRILQEVRPMPFTEHEYPRVWQQDIKRGRNRNKACPCGSGLKYKKCHGATRRSPA